MTDRVKGFLVTLENELRTDDAEPLAEAIRHLRGVVDVTPQIMESGDYMIRQQVRHELMRKLFDAINEKGLNP